MIEKVRTAGLDAPVQDVANLMNKYQIGCVIIVDDCKPVGIITERDMIKRVICKEIAAESLRAMDVMSKPLVNASPNMRAGDACKIMLEWNIKKLPVVDEGKLVGLVTLTDLLRTEGVIEALNGCALNGVSRRLKKTLEIYFDDGIKKKTRRCPLMYKDGMSVGCQLNKCMWWAGDECAVTKISQKIELEQFNDEVSCTAE
ncbi:CBS domain-containing protein [Candidatus Bathyarchaeota archaeon]|nr:CBS domain-containing protein [Candidatus Bathyarchaeota archaeon]